MLTTNRISLEMYQINEETMRMNEAHYNHTVFLITGVIIFAIFLVFFFSYYINKKTINRDNVV